jgi:hypothetical protein
MMNLVSSILRASRVVVAVLCSAIGQLPVAAQDAMTNALLRGTVVDHLSATPIDGAAVHLLSVDGRTLRTVMSDSLGRFALPLGELREFRISSERIGYRTMQSRTIVLGAQPWEPLQLRLPPSALPLPAITVTSEAGLSPIRRTEQLIYGRVFEDNTTTPIASVTVHLLHHSGRSIARTTSDVQGFFRLVTPIPAVYRLRGERVGYRTTDSPDIGTGLGDTLAVDFFLGVDVLPLAPLIVRASAKPWGPRASYAHLEDFYRRMARWHVFSEFMTQEELARADSAHVTLSQLIGQRVLRNPRACTGGTKYFLNGGEVRMDTSGVGLDMFLPRDLAGVEVHTAPQIPAEFGLMPPSPRAQPGQMVCKVVAVWLKH